MTLTTEQANALMARRKRITEPLIWRPRETRSGYEIDVAVGFFDDETKVWEIGRLVALAVPGKRANCSILFSSVPLRRLCDAHQAYHKHRWRNGGQRDAYVPDDIHPEIYKDDPDSALLDFLKECEVEVSAPHQRLLL